MAPEWEKTLTVDEMDKKINRTKESAFTSVENENGKKKTITYQAHRHSIDGGGANAVFWSVFDDIPE